jgi:hypothetical protein
LKQTITLENQRIDLDKIYNHPFFNGGKGLSKDKFPEYNENNKDQFIKELKELPLKEGLILTHRRNEVRNGITFNPTNIISSPESSNANGIKINELLNVSRNNSGQSSKNVSFNIGNENLKLNRNSNLKNIARLKEKKKEKENDKEISKNESPDDFLENLTKTITDIKVQNQIKEFDENLGEEYIKCYNITNNFNRNYMETVSVLQ